MDAEDTDPAPGTPREPRGQAEDGGIWSSGPPVDWAAADWAACDLEPERPRTPENTACDSWSPLSPFTQERLLGKFPWMQGLDIVQNVQGRNSTVCRMRLAAGVYVCKKECLPLRAAEIEAWNESEHANVVRWEFLPTLDTAAMRFVPGVTLHEHLERHGRVERGLRGIVQQSLRGVVFLHGRQTAHGDLNPRNIVFDAASGRVVLVDVDNSMRLFYGRRAAEPVRLEGCTSAPCIMSPETARAYTEGFEVGMPADVWAVGMVLLFLQHGLHLRVVNPAQDATAAIQPHDAEPMAYMFWLMQLAARPAVVGPTAAPRWAEAVLAGCLRPDARARAAAAAVLGELEEMLE